MSRIVLNVASDSWVKGQNRLKSILHDIGQPGMFWTNELPAGSPPHRTAGVLKADLAKCVPYAFKAYAMEAAMKAGHTSLLWADSCIVLGAKPLESLWERIERDGYWISGNPYNNYEWTADSAYPELFPECGLTLARIANKEIPHVVATTFGISLAHPLGIQIFDEFLRLAKTKAFRGPWTNGNAEVVQSSRGTAPCGPPDVWGHRHDQAALSVIAWRLGCQLTKQPGVFAYRGGETEDTVLIADGNY